MISGSSLTGLGKNSETKLTDNGKKTLSEKLADSHYQPSKAEMEQEYDMPGADIKCRRGAFFSPSEAEKPKPDKK